MSPPPLPSSQTELPKPSAASAHDSSPELPEEADPLVGDLDSSPGLPEEADPLTAADDGADGEEDNGDEADEGEEADKEADGKLVENGNERTDSYDADENDMSKTHEGSWKEPKSASPISKRPFINSANSHVKYKGGNPPSESHNEKAYELNKEDVSQNISQMRPRCSSPDTDYEMIVSKKSAIICSYFARGWCIKGSSCRFLHKKEGVVYGSRVANEETGTTEDSTDCKGSEMVEKSSLSTSVASIGLSNIENSILLQRALIRTYGDEGHEVNNDRNAYASRNYSNEQFQVDVVDNDRASLEHDELSQKSMLKRNIGIDGVMPYVESIDDRHSVSGEIPSIQYFNEGMMHMEMPRGGFRKDTALSGPSSRTKSPLTSDYNYFSAGSSIGINVYNDSSGIYSYAKRSDNVARQYLEDKFTRYDSHTTCSMKSSFDDSLHSLRVSPSVESVHSFAQVGTRLADGSRPLSDEHKDVYRICNYIKGFGGSTSGQLNVTGDPLSCVKEQNFHEYSWETSVPFRPSFFYAPFIKPRSEGQYDPLIDSIDNQKEGIKTSFSPRGASESMLSQHILGAPILPGEIIPEYDAKNSVNSFTQASQDMKYFKESRLEYYGFTTAAAPTSPAIDAMQNWVPDVTDATLVKDVEHGNSMRDAAKGKDAKESKAMKLFHAALVDFVKELLKPFWKEGRLSKDAHKLIVRKSVGKVTSALHPHQVPVGTESIDHYLSSSRPKLLKLVEAYVDKYNKS